MLCTVSRKCVLLLLAFDLWRAVSTITGWSEWTAYLIVHAKENQSWGEWGKSQPSERRLELDFWNFLSLTAVNSGFFQWIFIQLSKTKGENQGPIGLNFVLGFFWQWYCPKFDITLKAPHEILFHYQGSFSLSRLLCAWTVGMRVKDLSCGALIKSWVPPLCSSLLSWFSSLLSHHLCVLPLTLIKSEETN